MRAAKLGLALGSGSARGWSHIGILRALEEMGLRPTVVAGCSVGSLVAAAYASGALDRLEAWVQSLTRMDVLRLLDTSFNGGGMMQGHRLMRAIRDNIGDREIADLPVAYASVATDLDTGQEVWLQKGSTIDAVRASSGLPGLFAPVWYEDRWLMDGGVVNPVPVSLCRAMGADFVIAVNLNAHLSESGLMRRRMAQADKREAEVPAEASGRWAQKKWSEIVVGFISTLRSSGEDPGLLDVIATSVNIMQDRITRSRLVGDPATVVLSPDLGHFQLMDFHRAAEAIAIGRQSVEHARQELVHLQTMLEKFAYPRSPQDRRKE